MSSGELGFFGTLTLLMQNSPKCTTRVFNNGINGHYFCCSFVYILISHDGKLKPSKSEASHSYREAADRGLVYYVTAALDYVVYNASNTFTLGNGITTTG